MTLNQKFQEAIEGKKIKRLEIDKLRDSIIIEKHEGDTILKGSKLFCACCGNKMAVAKKDIILPFNSDHLVKNLKEISFEISRWGVRHTCRHTMFTFRGIGFSKLNEFIEKHPKVKIVYE